MGMQVGPSVRGFDMDNSSAENAAVIRYTGKISLHARVIYSAGLILIHFEFAKCCRQPKESTKRENKQKFSNRRFAN